MALHADPGRLKGFLQAMTGLALAGLGLDLPEVGPIFEDYVAEQGVQERPRFADGGASLMNPEVPPEMQLG